MIKSIYERVLNLRNRISLDGDGTIYEEDHLLLDEVLDYIEDNEQKVGGSGMTSKEAKNYLISLIERDTPMIPIYKSIELICPKCRERQHTNTARFCRQCGQRLDKSNL